MGGDKDDDAVVGDADIVGALQDDTVYEAIWNAVNSQNNALNGL